VACAVLGALGPVLAVAPALAAGGLHETVVVIAVDKGARKLTVKMTDGTTDVLQVAPDVKSFDNVKVADKIDVDYRQSVSVFIPSPGSKPRASAQTVSAEVLSVDIAHHTITLEGPQGQQWTVRISDPAMQEKLRTLEPGRLAELTYSEALATAIRPASN
jgi:hypothetical protein